MSNVTESDSIAYLDALYKRPILPPAQVGLRRIEYLLTQLGKPHLAYRTVHITGTCGKGSTATMVGSILSAAGHKTGLFRSPHLDSYRERIAVNSQTIDPDDWCTVFNRVKIVAGRMESGDAPDYDLGRLSLFEMVWGMAALFFAESGIDVGVIEVGIGGRLSPTNILDADVAVVTNVSLDHTSFLGPTHGDIAREKAAIIKPGRNAVTAANQPDVLDIIRARVAELSARLWVVGNDVKVEVRNHDVTGETFDVATPRRSFSNLRLAMLGQHQVVNAATAVAATESLAGVGIVATAEAVSNGLQRASFPGRFEIISTDPHVILDGARNVASAQVLRDTVLDLFPGRSVTLLIGVLGDKDAEGMVEVLGEIATEAVVTQPPWEGRQGDENRLLSAFMRLGVPAQFEMEPSAAFHVALQATGSDQILLVTGSLYLVATVRHMLMASRAPAEAR